MAEPLAASPLPVPTMVESVMQMQSKEGLPLLIQWLPKLDGQLRQRAIAYLEEVAQTSAPEFGIPGFDVRKLADDGMLVH